MESLILEKEIVKYNRVKVELMKMARCIDGCTKKSEEEFYQNLCLYYSIELKRMEKSIEEIFDVTVCKCSG